MLTGRYASGVGVYDNAAELAAGTPTVVHALRAAGYDTSLAGKMHFVGPDQLHGFEQRLTTDIYPADVDWTPDWSRSLDEPLPWYHTMESVLTRARARPACRPTSTTRSPSRPCASCTTWPASGRRSPVPAVSCRSPTRTIRGRSRRATGTATGARRSTIRWCAPIPLERADPHSRRLRAMCRVDEARLTAEQIRRARHGYYAAVCYLDERIGEVLGALQRLGHGRPRRRSSSPPTTARCWASGASGTRCRSSSNSARVPLIVRVPGAGRRVESRSRCRCST